MAILLSCGPPQQKRELDAFSENFDKVSADTLHISYFKPDDTPGNRKNIPLPLFLAAVDSTSFFSDLHHWCESCSWDELRLLPVAQIKISEDVTGYIVMTGTSDILLQKADLFVFRDQKLLQQLRLAELKGSEGEYDQTDSWILKTKDKIFPCIVYQSKYSFQASKDSVTIRDSLWISSWDNDKKQYLNSVLKDTLGFGREFRLKR